MRSAFRVPRFALVGRQNLNVGRTRFRLIDIAVLAAASFMLVQAPLSVVEANWVPNLEPLPRLAIVGLLAGYVLERTRAPGAVGLLIGAVLGVEVITWVYARVAEGGSMFERVDWLGGRVGIWFEAVGGGGISKDKIVFALAMAGLAWLLGLVTAWLLFRDNAAWLAAVFNGVALLMNLSYASTSLVGHVGWFAFSACLVLAARHLANRTELWRRAELRVSWRVVANVLIGTALAAGGLLSLAWALPANVSSPEVASSWSRVTSPWSGLEGEFDRWFAALNGSANARGPLAPRGAFDLGDTPVLEVKALGPLYLRATTADRYAGQAITSSDTTTTGFDPNTDLLPADAIPQGRGLLTAQIKVLASRTSVALAPDTPLRFSLPIELDTRADPSDVASVRLDAPVQQNHDYTVISAISTATVQDLRMAGEEYPDWVRLSLAACHGGSWSWPTRRPAERPRRTTRPRRWKPICEGTSRTPRTWTASRLTVTGWITSCSSRRKAIATTSRPRWWCCCALKAFQRGWPRASRQANSMRILGCRSFARTTPTAGWRSTFHASAGSRSSLRPFVPSHRAWRRRQPRRRRRFRTRASQRTPVG